MSKYNLIDILEQYKIGSGWTNDFDYAGMLNAGLETGVDTDIEVLKKMSDDFEDVNYHRENNHLQMAIDALEEGAIKEASMFFGDFHAEIKATMETFDMDIEPTLGKFMASKMEEKEEKKLPMDENEEAVDLAIEVSQEKAGINEVRIDRDVAERIEGFLNIPMKAKFLNAFEDLIYDLLDDEPFYVDDVIAHLSNEMHKRINGNQVAGERLAGIGENLDDLNDDEYDDGPNGKFVKEINIDKVASPDAKAHDYGAEIKGISDEDDTEEAYAHQTVLPLEEDDYTDRKGRALYPILKAGANATGDEVEMYVQSLSKDIELNGKEQYREFTADDFVEDFKNYIADKSLQEHFKRFM